MGKSGLSRKRSLRKCPTQGQVASADDLTRTMATAQKEKAMLGYHPSNRIRGSYELDFTTDRTPRSVISR